VLRVSPVSGRNFNADEDKPGGPLVVILSHKLWSKQFAADPAMVGKTITLDGGSYTVVGVMGTDFSFPTPEIDAWLPRVFEPSFLNRDTVDRGAGYLNMMGRLNPGVTVQQAQAEMESIAESSKIPDHPDSGFGAVVVPFPESATQGVRPTLFI